MPLVPGSSRAVISQNISEMVHAGHPQNQAVAASLKKASKSKKRLVLRKRAAPKSY